MDRYLLQRCDARALVTVAAEIAAALCPRRASSAAAAGMPRHEQHLLALNALQVDCRAPSRGGRGRVSRSRLCWAD